MAHNKVYAICENMCMEETMTKEQINNGLGNKSDTSHNHDDVYSKLGHNHDDRYYTESEMNTKLAGKSDTSHNHDTRYKLQGDFAVLTGTITLSSGTGMVDINYPSGFTQSNCVPVACAINVTMSYDFGNPGTSNLVAVKLLSNIIRINTSPSTSGGASGDKTYKLVLMKVS